jgi:hypothetical protein
VLDVRRLIESQFPEWSDLPITPAEPQGWDNRRFRLGEELVVRLPRDEAYAAQVEKEQRWLPVPGPSRDRFRAELDIDDDTWSRGRGWALWKELIPSVAAPEDA